MIGLAARLLSLADGVDPNPALIVQLLAAGDPRLPRGPRGVSRGRDGRGLSPASARRRCSIRPSRWRRWSWCMRRSGSAAPAARMPSAAGGWRRPAASRLSPADRALLDAWDIDGHHRSRIDRAAGTRHRRPTPTAPRAWYELGDAYFHNGGSLAWTIPGARRGGVPAGMGHRLGHASTLVGGAPDAHGGDRADEGRHGGCAPARRPADADRLHQP